MWGTYTDEDKVKVQLSADHDTYVHFYAQDAAGNESDYANINLGKGEAVTPTPTPSVDSVAVSGDGVKDGKLALVAGGAAQLSAEVKVTGDAAKTVSWKSSDEKVATVDKDGKVTAVAEGTATITATSMVDENKSASVEVTVTKPRLRFRLPPMRSASLLLTRSPLLRVRSSTRMTTRLIRGRHMRMHLPPQSR